MKYTRGRCKVPSGQFELKFKAEIQKHAIRSILILVVFLDRAKGYNLLDSTPCLFTKRKGAVVKSSRDVLSAFCRDYLSGVGDIVKHLSNVGIRFTYKQEPIDEYDYFVTNLAVDLRDGVRLSRMIEVLTNDTKSSLLAQLRLPAVSRLQKLHNVGIALSALESYNINNVEEIAAHHVVDGHRANVLKLLWAIISHFQLESLLDAELLREEISSVRRMNRTRKMSEGRSNTSFDLNNTSRFTTDSALAEGLLYQGDGELVGLLLQWCQVVCSCFGCQVENFSTAFADGKVMCLLIHYYHPGILKAVEILPTTRDLDLSAQMRESGNHGAEEKALENEHHNSALANRRMSEIGGIPDMLPVTNSLNIPEEKSMILCTAYLCSRLMESSREISATIVIQNCYRHYRKCVMMERQTEAAAVIWGYWKENRARYFRNLKFKFKEPVSVIVRFFLNHEIKFKEHRAKRKQEEMCHSAACHIQVCYSVVFFNPIL